jgi:methylmalonyl-CoA mutase N-terminal domain/subunit
MVGVNAFMQEDDDEPEIHRADPDSERIQIERVRAWKANREPLRHARSLEALSAACRSGENVMPHLVEGARAGATLGEMCDVFREEFGRYRDPARW